MVSETLVAEPPTRTESGAADVKKPVARETSRKRPSNSTFLQLSRYILVAPGLTIIFLTLIVDLIAWNSAALEGFGLGRVIILTMGLLTTAVGYFVPRLLPISAVRACVRITFAGGLFFVLFSFVDVAFRLSDPFGLAYYVEANRYFTEMVPDEKFAYIHETGSSGVFQDVDVTINQEGFRWPAHSISKPEGRQRLLVLGDSVVFGWGVEQEEIFPTVIQKTLSQRDSNWEVIAAGVGSWNTRTEFEWLNARGLEYEPDVVLLNIVSNDVVGKPTGNHEVAVEPSAAAGSASLGLKSVIRPFWNHLACTSYLCGYLQHMRAGRVSRTNEDRRFEPDSWEWRDARAAMREMQAICRKNNVKLVAAIPYFDDEDRPFNKSYKSALEEFDIPYTVIPDVGPHRNSRVDRHPNGEGHRMMADHLTEFLAPHLQ